MINNPFKPGTKSYQVYEGFSPEQKQKVLTAVTQQGQQPQPGKPGLADIVKGKVVNKGLNAAANAIGGAFAADGAIAAVPTTLSSIAGPQMALPALSYAAPGGASAIASGAATTGATAAPAGLSGLASVAAPAAIIAAPFLAKKLFGGATTQRPFNVDEVAQDMPGKRSYLNEQIPGYETMTPEAKKKFLTVAHDAGVLALAGTGKHDEAGNIVTKERKPEYINWSGFLGGPAGETDRNSKWYNGNTAPVPTADEINNAYWLKDSKKKELLGVLSAIAPGETNG